MIRAATSSHPARRDVCVQTFKMRRARAGKAEITMSKKNSGINDRHDESGEQSHVDGNSGLDNLIDGEALPDPPDVIDVAQARELQRRASTLTRTPTKRDSDIF